MNKELLELSVIDLAEKLRSKAVSPVEVTDNLLSYIEQSNKLTNAAIFRLRPKELAKAPNKPSRTSWTVSTKASFTACIWH